MFRRILFVFLLIEGMVFTFGLPPFQKFDEPTHFVRTIALSKGQFFCKSDRFVIPKAYNNLISEYKLEKVLLANEKFPVESVDFNRVWTKEELVQEERVIGCGLNFLGYLPNVFGVELTAWTNRPAVIFYAGRITGFLFLLTMLAWGSKIIDRKFRYLLWFYALMPMVVHQATSYSYDVVIVSLVLPLTALLVNKIVSKKQVGGDLLAWLLILVMSMIKIVYLPLIVVFWIVDWFKIKTGKEKIVFLIKNTALLGVVGLAAMVVRKIGLDPTDYQLFINPGLQKMLLMKDPLYFGVVLANTFRQQWQSLVLEMVGVFGWRNVFMTDSFVVYVFLWLCWLVVRKLANDLRGRIRPIQSFLWLGVLLLVTILISLAMYMVASAVGDRTINGVQSRYLLPMMPIGLIFGAGLLDWIGKCRMAKYGVIILIGAGVIGSMVHGLNQRFFDYSTDWINGPKEEDVLEEVFDVIAVDKKIEFVLASGGKNVSGLKFRVKNDNGAVLIPYRYKVKDENCDWVLRSGYLSVWGIQGDNVYAFGFRPIRGVDKLCLELEPVLVNKEGYETYLNIGAEGDELEVEWLYF